MVKERSTAGDLFTATKRGLDKAHVSFEIALTAYVVWKNIADVEV